MSISIKPTHVLTMKTANGELYNHHSFWNIAEGFWESVSGLKFSGSVIHSLVPLSEAAEEEPETFDWTTAAVLWGQRVKIEYRPDSESKWIEIDADAERVMFIKYNTYRRKPVEPVIYTRYHRIFGDNIIDAYSMSFESIWKTKLNVVSCLEITFTNGKPTGSRIIGKEAE